MFTQNEKLSFATAIVASGLAVVVQANVLTTESFSLPYGPGNSDAAQTYDEVFNTSPLSTWGEKGAEGVEGSQSIYPSGGGYVNNPASILALKFNVGSAIDSLNSTYGAGNWSISNPTLTFQYTLYANNPVFGSGAGTFDTYWVANDNWHWSNAGSAGNSIGAYNYVAGTDPAFAANPTALLTWAGNDADLGSTTYNWLSPADNPNYINWSTDKTGLNQGLLTVTLATDPSFINDILSATSGTNANISLYLMPTSDTLGLTIFTGGGTSTPTLSFNVISVPEPTTLAAFALIPILAFRRRK
ncbi:MAG TPA: hypothetical protein VG722_06605 [Tepidisphaeraceae bacterium]|nr:hypothetical protein [Tepidisphaeraceae bacterium]